MPEPSSTASERVLDGLVEDGESRPVGLAEVAFEGSAEGARTGPDGRFSLRLAPGASPTLLVVRHGGRTVRVRLERPEADRVRVVLVTPDAVPIRVLTPGSAPVPRRFGWAVLSRGAAGVAAGPTGEASSPRFSVRDLPAGSYAIAVWAGPFLPAVEDEILLDGSVSHGLVTIELMRRGASIAGRVVSASGAPRAGASVVARSEDPSARAAPGRSTCAADAGGRYRLEGLPPGRYVLAVETGLGPPAETTVNLLAREERALDLVA